MGRARDREVQSVPLHKVLSACLRNKKSKIQPWFWSSIGSNFRDPRKVKKQRWEEEETSNF